MAPSSAIIEILPCDENDDTSVVKGRVVDYKGRTAKKSQAGYWKSAYFIIGVGMAERFAYYGVSANLITYLTGPLWQSTATAAANVNIWSGTGALLPLFGGFVADSFLGRFRTIIVASLVSFTALGLLTISAMLDCPNASRINSCFPTQIEVYFFFSSLHLFALGQAAHRPCIITFGADQFDYQDPQEIKGRSSFFSWWFFCTSCGCLVALPVLNYIQDYLNWGLGFGIPCISMAISLVIFFSGYKSYQYTIKTDEDCPFSRIAQVFIKAAMNWRSFPPESAYIEEDQEAVPRLSSQQFKFLDKALLSSDGLGEYRAVCGNDEVEEAKALLRLVPIWATSLSYAIVISQTTTLFTEQGITVDRSIGSSFNIPAASLQYLIGFSAVLSIPMYDHVFTPLARAITGVPSGMTKLQRIGIGMILCTLSMVIAALVEKKRLQTASAHGLTDFVRAIVPMRFWWLFPQYILLGISYVFTLIGLQELFYEEVPPDLKSTGMSFCISISGMGDVLSSFLIALIQKLTCRGGEGGWFSDNMNQAHIDYFYWLLAGLNVVEFLAFLYFTKSYDNFGSLRKTSTSSGTTV